MHAAKFGKHSVPPHPRVYRKIIYDKPRADLYDPADVSGDLWIKSRKQRYRAVRVVCKWCKTVFLAKLTQVRKGRAVGCSKKCAMLWRRAEERNCKSVEGVA
jgi:hypothetical protein